MDSIIKDYIEIAEKLRRCKIIDAPYKFWNIYLERITIELGKSIGKSSIQKTQVMMILDI